MAAPADSVRALLVYVLILPLALIMGYLLASPGEFGTWATVGIVVLVMCAPVILAKHHAVLFLAWNTTAIIFFLPGQPPVWMAMSAVSLFVSLFQRALSRDMRFLSAPSILLPL